MLGNGDFLILHLISYHTVGISKTVHSDPHLPEAPLMSDSIYRQHPLTLGDRNVTVPICWPWHCEVKSRLMEWPGCLRGPWKSHCCWNQSLALKPSLVRAVPLFSCCHCWCPRFPLRGRTWALPSRIPNGSTWNIFYDHIFAGGQPQPWPGSTEEVRSHGGRHESGMGIGGILQLDWLAVGALLYLNRTQ